MIISRVWAMPNHETFSIPPIKAFLSKYTAGAGCIVDPFARNSKLAHHTNDINPKTTADFHMDVLDFLEMLLKDGVRADCIIFDPPYSLRQVKEMYNSFGVAKLSQRDTQRVGRWSKEKAACYELLRVGGSFIHFGWHSNGLGKKNMATIEEIMIVAHGGAHNDTICMCEKKKVHQLKLL